MWLKSLIILCFIVVFTVGLSCDRMLPVISEFAQQRTDDDSAIYFSMLLIGALLWPFIWYLTIGFDVIRTCPVVIIGLLWPMLMTIGQLYDTYHDRCETTQNYQEQRSNLILGISSDAATIVSFGFASSTLLWAIKDTENTAPSARLLFISLLICIALIVPTNGMFENNQRYTSYVRSAQRTCMNYALGFIITALVMVLSKCFTKWSENV